MQDLQDHEIVINDEVIADFICNYTRESGVRELERLIHKLCAKTARIIGRRTQNYYILN